MVTAWECSRKTTRTWTRIKPPSPVNFSVGGLSETWKRWKQRWQLIVIRLIFYIYLPTLSDFPGVSRILSQFSSYCIERSAHHKNVCILHCHLANAAHASLHYPGSVMWRHHFSRAKPSSRKGTRIRPIETQRRKIQLP